MGFANHLKKLVKGNTPWLELEKNFKLKLICEECNLETPILFTVEEVELNCEECKEAKERRTRLTELDEEWGDPT